MNGREVAEANNYRESFVWYRSFKDCAKALPLEHRVELYEGIMDYGLDQSEPIFSNPYLQMAWALIKPQLDANWKRFKNGCKGALHGKKGGAPKGNKNALKQPQNNPKTTPNVNVNVNVNENECVTHTRTREENLSPEDEQRLSSFDSLLAEKAPTFAKSVSPVSLEKLNELKAHASTDDIIEVMEEIENKVAGKETCPYSDVASTIRIFLQTKGVWKRTEK